jgi:hypothetical protein
MNDLQYICNYLTFGFKIQNDSHNMFDVILNKNILYFIQISEIELKVFSMRAYRNNSCWETHFNLLSVFYGI